MVQDIMEGKMRKRKKYHALVVDDDIDFIEILALHAREKHNIELLNVTNFEDMKLRIPDLINRISSIILDVRCMITADQEKEHENFLNTALGFLKQEYPDLPRIIFTGDSGLFSDISRFIKDEILLTKNTEDRDKLFGIIIKNGNDINTIRLRH